MRILRHVRIPARDGIRLAADVYLPDDTTPVPAVIQYQPYRKDDLVGTGPWQQRLPEAGYAFVQLDVRGSGASEGVSTDEYLPVEQTDGYDAVEWIARQPWCDGQVNFWGSSYSGFSGLQVASHQPPSLRTVMTMYFTDDRYTDDCHYRGGLLGMYYDAGSYANLMVAMNAMPPDAGLDDWARIWDQHIAGQRPYQLNWLAEPVDGPYWRAASPGARVDRITVPVLMIGGWRDGYPNPPFRLFAALSGPKKLVIGPWNHFGPDIALPGPRIDHYREVIRWLDHWCKGRPTGVLDEAPITVFMQRPQAPVVDRLDSEGSWRGEAAWPVPGATTRSLPISPGRVTYRATFGAAAGGLWSGGLTFGLAGDQRVDDAYAHVVRWDPLDADLSILGRAHAELELVADAPVVAIALRLCDVARDGTSQLVAKGILNLTRRSSLTAPEPVVPGEPMRVSIEIDATGWVFPAGHRVALGIAGGDFPNQWPTPFPATIEILGGTLTLPEVPAAGSAVPTSFVASPVVATPVAAAPDRPTWDHRVDVLTGVDQVIVRVDREWRIDTATTAVRHQEMVATADPSDPAHASVRGRQRYIRSRDGFVVDVTAVTEITSTETAFRTEIDLDVLVNGEPKAHRHWSQVDERRLM